MVLPRNRNRTGTAGDPVIWPWGLHCFQSFESDRRIDTTIVSQADPRVKCGPALTTGVKGSRDYFKK
jgi:hypothetical protein